MSVSGLFQILLFASVFLVFIDGSIGWLLIYALGIALVISFALCFASRGRFDVRTEEFSGSVPAGKECEVRVTLTKKGFCLLPHITLEGSYAGQKFAVKTALLFKSSVEIPLKLKSQRCGLQYAVVERSVSEDFFGLFRFKRGLSEESAVAVLPREVLYTGPVVTPSLLPSEDEEREEGSSVMFGGSAGYEHRPYAEGDSPRRINYKLSAKRQQLMVRLDESNGTESTNIIIEDGAGGDMAEQALALVKLLAAADFPAAVYCGGECFPVASAAALDKLREWLAFCDFDSENVGNLPANGSVSVVFSKSGIKTIQQ